MRTNKFRFYVDVEMAHSGGRVAVPRRLEELVRESLEMLVEKGEHYGFGVEDAHSAETTYTVVESNIVAIDAAAARRLVGPAIAGPVDPSEEPVHEAVTGGLLHPPAPPVAVAPEPEILPRGRWVPETPPAGPARKGWRTIAAPVDPYKFGDVVEASITEPGKGRHEGKLRPCVWVAEDKLRRYHAVAKLTSLDRFEDGMARPPLNWTGGIYKKGSHLWTDRLTWIPERAIQQVLGHLDDADLKMVMNTYRSELLPLGVDCD